MSEEIKKKAAKTRSEISRRQFLIDTGLVAGGAALGATALLSSCGSTTTETMTSTVTSPGQTVTSTMPAVTVTSPPVTTTVTATAQPLSLEFYDPTAKGADAITALYAPRLDTLDGKTIALMACDASKWQTFRILPYIANLIQKRYPTAKIIPMTEFTQGQGVDSDADAQKAKDKGADAMIDAYAA